MIDNLMDAAGSGIMPHGGRGDRPGRHRAGAGALTGALGGRGRGRGALLAAAAYWLRRVRHQARHAR